MFNEREWCALIQQAALEGETVKVRDKFYDWYMKSKES